MTETPSAQLTTTLSQDKTLCRVQLEAGEQKIDLVLSAAEIYKMIVDLAIMRDQMVEKFPAELKGKVNFDLGTRDPCFALFPNQTIARKEMVLALRHGGLGWVAYAFGEPQMMQMVEAIFATGQAMNPIKKPNGLIIPN
jgi:hypothetical protein